MCFTTINVFMKDNIYTVKNQRQLLSMTSSSCLSLTFNLNEKNIEVCECITWKILKFFSNIQFQISTSAGIQLFSHKHGNVRTYIDQGNLYRNDVLYQVFGHFSKDLFNIRMWKCIEMIF